MNAERRGECPGVGTKLHCRTPRAAPGERRKTDATTRGRGRRRDDTGGGASTAKACWGTSMSPQTDAENKSNQATTGATRTAAPEKKT